MNCKNCNKPISCGCQKAVAKDGSTVCKMCLTEYNNKLQKQNVLWSWDNRKTTKVCTTDL